MKAIALAMLTALSVSTACAVTNQAIPADTDSPSLEDLLDAILIDIIVGDEESDRSKGFYGTPGDQEIVLVNYPRTVPWPEAYAPRELHGWRLLAGEKYSRPTEESLLETNRKLGITIRALAINPVWLAEGWRARGYGSIVVGISNVGGAKNGGVMGGTLHFYSVEVKNGKWVVTLTGSFS